MENIENPIVVQLRVITALLLRETRVAFGNSQFGYLWAIANPVLSVTVLVLIFSAISRHPPIGNNFALFFAVSILPFQMQRKLNSSLMNVFNANKGLLTYPLVKEGDIIFARFLLVFTTYIMVMIVFFGSLILFFDSPLPANFDDVLIAIIITALLGFGGGLTNAVILKLWPTWKEIESILSRPLLFISGIFFIPSFFSPEIRAYLYWNPLLHVIEWMREGYYPSYQSVILDKSYLLFITSLLIICGLGGERLFRKKQ